MFKMLINDTHQLKNTSVWSGERIILKKTNIRIAVSNKASQWNRQNFEIEYLIHPLRISYLNAQKISDRIVDAIKVMLDLCM